MFSRPKYTYYSHKDDNNYRGSKKKKYKAEKRKVSDYDEIKEDAYKFCYDVKKLFNKKGGCKIKVPKSNCCNDRKTMRAICLGLIGFTLMSTVITFPLALFVCLIGALLYSTK
ncbi:MAG: hypothetical protein ACRC6T_03160 [Sarcina sp.]